MSRRLDFPPSFGPLVLSDFDFVRVGEEVNDEGIQPPMYQESKILLEMEWSYGVDIWNAGVMASLSRTQTIFLLNIYRSGISFSQHLNSILSNQIQGSMARNII